MREPEMDYLCLKCGREFKNDLKLAICPICLKIEKENYQKGIPSKYMTVLRFLKSQVNKSDLIYQANSSSFPKKFCDILEGRDFTRHIASKMGF